MISDVPTKSAAHYFTIAERVTVFISAAREASRDGITWGEFGELTVALLRLSIATLEQVSTLSGAEKKEIALEAVAALFDTVADKAVPLTVYPLYMLARPAVRSLVLALASGAVEGLLPLVRVAQC